jgi:hypothetical protein
MSRVIGALAASIHKLPRMGAFPETRIAPVLQG